MSAPVMPSTASVNWATAPLNLVYDGNSFIADVGASSAALGVAARTAAGAPVSGRVAMQKIGVSGQTINQMRGRRAANLDPKWVSGAVNILIASEITNSICNSPNRLGLEAADDLRQYCKEVLAIHPWIIVLTSAIPRFGMNSGIYASNVPAGNAQIAIANQYVAEHYRDMGAQAFVDWSASGVFVAPPSATVPPSLMAGYMAEAGVNAIHPNDAGHQLLANMNDAALRRLRTR